MALDYCHKHHRQFDRDRHEDCPRCLAEPIDAQDVHWTIYPTIGDRAVYEIDCTYHLIWDDVAGWVFDGVTIDDLDGKPIRIERDGTIKLGAGWHQHAPLATCIKVAAEHTFDAERDRITADLPSHWPVETPDFSDREYRRMPV